MMKFFLVVVSTIVLLLMNSCGNSSNTKDDTNDNVNHIYIQNSSDQSYSVIVEVGEIVIYEGEIEPVQIRPPVVEVLVVDGFKDNTEISVTIDQIVYTKPLYNDIVDVVVNIPNEDDPITLYTEKVILK